MVPPPCCDSSFSFISINIKLSHISKSVWNIRISMSSKNKNPFCSCLPISLTHNKVSEEEKNSWIPKTQDRPHPLDFMWWTGMWWKSKQSLLHLSPWHNCITSLSQFSSSCRSLGNLKKCCTNLYHSAPICITLFHSVFLHHSVPRCSTLYHSVLLCTTLYQEKMHGSPKNEFHWAQIKSAKTNNEVLCLAGRRNRSNPHKHKQRGEESTFHIREATKRNW